MAIRFLCQECRQLLSIASRKAGTVIECPKCAAIQVVPDEETARTELGQISPRYSHRDSASDLAEEAEDGLVLLEEPAAFSASRPPPARPTPAPELPPPPTTSSSLPYDWILFRRRTIYLQGILFVVTALVSLAFGVAIGRVSTFVAPVRGGLSASGDEPGQVLVNGKLSYDPGDGKLAGDEESVILFLPENTKPAKPIPISGLRPQDPPPVPSHRGLRSLEELGGVYARADADGAFRVVLPHGGKYRLLLISRHANRPKDDYVDEVDRAEIGEYVNRAEDLVGLSKYRWTLETFRSGGPSVMHNFGRDGQE